jgi:hypothetical protein
MTQTVKTSPKSLFVGEVFPFFPLCIDEGSSRSMPNREHGGIRSQPWTNPLKRVKRIETRGCTFFFTTFRTLWCSEVLARDKNRSTARRKNAMDKTPNRAGATPLFRLSAAQKVRGIAPALSRSLRDPS